jgi:putative transposase
VALSHLRIAAHLRDRRTTWAGCGMPGRPVENGLIESFNGKLRDECLNTSWFHSLEEARRGIEAWRIEYNEQRPHSSLSNLAPAEFVARLMAWSGSPTSENSELES